MKYYKYLLLFIISFIYGIVPLFAVAKPHQVEKVYLHFDNTAYFMGETIWFKAYVVQAGRNGLSPLSKTLYVDLVTPDGNVIEAKKFKLVDGKANGEFMLKDSLLAGFYEVRAYTRFMLNQGDEAVFKRVFACYDKPEITGDYQNPKMFKRNHSLEVPDNRPKPLNNDKLNVFFYPEGGDLIEQMTTRVAFKAFDREGGQVAITGVVLSKTGDTLANLYTSNMGMGVFNFTPEKGASLVRKPYEAVVTYNNKNYRFDMPQPLADGYALKVDVSNPEQLDMMVQRSPNPSMFAQADSSASFPEILGVDISCRGVLYGEDTLSFESGKAVLLTFPTRMLPTGVVQINLHTLDGRPLAQRLAFVNHHTQLNMEAKPDKPNYRPYEPIKIDFSLKDTKANPVQTDFSLSIRDAATTPTNSYDDNLLTNLLLSSELRGYIQSPGYYFQDDSPERRADLDLLMMTQGWSRYEWKRIAGLDTTQFKHLYEESLLVEGNVYTLKKSMPSKGVEVSVTLDSDTLSVKGNCVSDSSGRFSIMITDCYGKYKMKIETKLKGELKEHDVRLDRVFSPSVRAFAPGENHHPQLVNTPLNEPLTPQPDTVVSVQEETPIWIDSLDLREDQFVKNAANPLPEVVVRGKRKIKEQQELYLGVQTLSINVEETFERYIDMGKFVPTSGMNTLFELLPYFSLSFYAFDNRVELIPLYKNKQAGIGIVDENGHSVYRGETPADVLYNGLTSNEIVSISVMEDPAFNIYSILIHTKNVDHSPLGIRSTTFQGYSLTKSFYSPPYDLLGLPDPDDVRRTLYWNPSVKTDANGKASVSFYNNRSAKTINISAETVTSTGMMGVLNQ